MKFELKSISAATAVAFLVTVSPALAQDRYVSGALGYAGSSTYDFSFVSNTTSNSIAYTTDLSSGYFVSVAVGWENLAGPGTRAEIELSHLSFGSFGDYVSEFFRGIGPSGRITATTLFGNVWYDHDMDSSLTPYVGGGIGLSILDGDFAVTNGVGQQFNGSDVGIGVQLGIGVRTPLSDGMTLDIGYRYIAVSATSPSSILGFSTANGSLGAHVLRAGLQTEF